MAMQGLHADLNVAASGLIINPAAMDERMSPQLSQLHVLYQMPTRDFVVWTPFYTAHPV